jgi:xanthine dehydrogenase small subunit
VTTRPTTLPEALALLEARPDLLPLAGCTDVMVAAPERRPGRQGVLDLLRIPELHGIRRSAGHLEIGATTTFSEIASSPDVRDVVPALAGAARQIGGWQIQNRATIGGNVANASPAGDSLPVLLACDAAVIAEGPHGRREMPCDSFYVSYRRTRLDPGELIVAVRIPMGVSGARQAFRKVGTREAQAISKVVVALVANVTGDGIVAARVAAGSVAPVPVRLRETERYLQGRTPDPETAAAAGRIAAGEIEPIDDVRSTARYRRYALERVVRRMVLGLAH